MERLAIGNVSFILWISFVLDCAFSWAARPSGHPLIAARSEAP